jgi:hypothetical protein
VWDEFGNEIPFGRKNFLGGFGKKLAVGSTPSFGKRTVCGSFREYVMTWPE